MICPRCNEILTRKKVDGEEIDFCGSCEGMWVHRSQLNKMISETDEDIEKYSTESAIEPHELKVVKCRECKDVVMKKIHFHDYLDIIIDYCPSCGSFWLDKGELENMHEHIKRTEDGSQQILNSFAYNLLLKLSQISYNIFH